MSWMVILIQGKGYISKKLLAFMQILTAEPNPGLLSLPDLYCCTKMASLEGKTTKLGSTSMRAARVRNQLTIPTHIWISRFSGEHNKDGCLLLSNSDLHISVTNKVISKKSFYLRKEGKKKSDGRYIFSSSWARKKKVSPYTELKSRTPAPRLVAEEHWNHS